MEIIKYEGNSNYILILYKQDNNLYILYARTEGLLLNTNVEEDEARNWNGEVIAKINTKRDFTINIPLLQRGNKAFSIIQIENEKVYDLIKRVVEDIL